jgi:hypothetical protein
VADPGHHERCRADSGLRPAGAGGDYFQDYTDSWWLYSGDAGTARDLLSTLLGGMITMTSLVVSITVVVLSLAANQLGPRLIYNFIEDRRIQSVIGLFVATILYTLLALRTIGDELGGEATVPHVVITVASVLTVACLFALLFHVNLIAHSIVSDTIVRDVADSLDKAVGKLPKDPAAAIDDPAPPSWRHSCSASTGKSGYVQVIDQKALVELAAEHDLLIVLKIRAGHFMLHDTSHFEVHSNEPVSDDISPRSPRRSSSDPGARPPRTSSFPCASWWRSRSGAVAEPQRPVHGHRGDQPAGLGAGDRRRPMSAVAGASRRGRAAAGHCRHHALRGADGRRLQPDPPVGRRQRRGAHLARPAAVRSAAGRVVGGAEAGHHEASANARTRRPGHPRTPGPSGSAEPLRGNRTAKCGPPPTVKDRPGEQ